MSDFDYNLLKVLMVLLETRSTTLAAAKLSTSQPAVSRSLSRLRDLFADDLLVRRGAMMELTPRAEDLKHRLPPLLGGIRQLVQTPNPFDPFRQARDLCVAMNASIAQWFAAPLAHHLAINAPNVNITIEDWTESTADKIADGDVHYGINYFPMALPKTLVQRKGGKDDFVLACWAGHPLAGQTMSLAQMERYPYALHLIKNWNDKEQHINRLLKAHSLTPRIQLRTTHLNIILSALQHSELLFPCSRHLAKQLGREYAYVETDYSVPTVAGNFGYVYGVKWRNDPWITWLHSQIVDLISQTTKEQSE